MSESSESEVPSDAMTFDTPEQVLEWCRAHPADPDALPRFNVLGELLLERPRAELVVSTAEALMAPVLQDASPSPMVHAHVMILMSWLLQLPTHAERIDPMVVAWLRHPMSYGSARATPTEFQRAEFVQRVADLIGWGTIDVVHDADALERFFSWVNSWSPKQKDPIRRVVAALRRNFPAPDLWKRVRM